MLIMADTIQLQNDILLNIDKVVAIYPRPAEEMKYVKMHKAGDFKECMWQWKFVLGFIPVPVCNKIPYSQDEYEVSTSKFEQEFGVFERVTAEDLYRNNTRWYVTCDDAGTHVWKKARIVYRLAGDDYVHEYFTSNEVMKWRYAELSQRYVNSNKFEPLTNWIKY